jgi:hypothetical protein
VDFGGGRVNGEPICSTMHQWASVLSDSSRPEATQLTFSCTNDRNEVIIRTLNMYSVLLGFRTLSIVRYSRLENTSFWKLDLFPSSGEEGGGEDTYSVGSLRKS